MYDIARFVHGMRAETMQSRPASNIEPVRYEL